jgi:pimeloyl-ACP methyl ester carboxylesterase
MTTGAQASATAARDWQRPELVGIGARRVSVRRAGADTGEPPALLLAGLGGSAAEWDTLAQALAVDRRVVGLDLPGFGGSPAGGSYALDGLCSLVGGLIEAEFGPAAGRVDVVGHDWGATLAIALAAARPDRMRRLAVVSGGWPPGLADRPEGGSPGVAAGQRIAAVMAGGVARRYIAEAGTVAGRPAPERSLVIWGTHERRLRPRYGENVVTYLGRYTDPATVAMITLPGVGHAPHIEARDRVAALLCEFLRSA